MNGWKFYFTFFFFLGRTGLSYDAYLYKGKNQRKDFTHTTTHILIMQLEQ